MTKAEKTLDEHFKDWIYAGQIRRNTFPAMAEHAIDFVRWIEEKCTYYQGGWSIDKDETAILYSEEDLYRIFNEAK